METRRFSEEQSRGFAESVFIKLGVPPETARLAVRSLLDASLLGVETHGIEALDMYVTHLRKGGLKAGERAERIGGSGGVELWDMHHGFGLAEARKMAAHSIMRCREHGIFLLTCRNTNHIGACGVYGKMAADEGLIGIVGQQTGAAFPPWGGRETRIGASPVAFVAPVAAGFPFYFDASLAAITHGQIKNHRRSGKPLPEGVALDADGKPTTDPDKAWAGQSLPIGGYKGVGLAMAFELFHCVLSGNCFARGISSIVDHPERSAGSSLFILAVDPKATGAGEDEFAARMKTYVESIESSPARDAKNPPRYPGRREGETWADRKKNGIPVSPEGLARLNAIAGDLGVHTLDE